jgi:hypothetical protein
MASVAVVPFSDILEGAKVRYTTIDGRPYLSVRDLIMVVCGKTGHFASQTWCRDITKEQHKELEDYVKTFQFSGILDSHNQKSSKTFLRTPQTILFSRTPRKTLNKSIF